MHPATNTAPAKLNVNCGVIRSAAIGEFGCKQNDVAGIDTAPQASVHKSTRTRFGRMRIGKVTDGMGNTWAGLHEAVAVL